MRSTAEFHTNLKFVSQETVRFKFWSTIFVTAHAITVTRWGNLRQLLCVEFDKDGIRLLFYPKISRNGCVTDARIWPPFLFWTTCYTTVARSTIDSSLISLSSEHPGEPIYYTINGENPNKSSTVFKKDFSIKKTTTIKAGVLQLSGSLGPYQKKRFIFIKQFYLF